MVENHPPAPEGAEKFKIGFETYLSPQKCVDFLNEELYPAIGKKKEENDVQ